VFALGGAGAIAALALGTESVPRADRIVGPGNAYVTEAKQQLTGQVAIDSPAGPSEVLIIADETADAEVIAVELLAQAEHDPDAAAVLVTTSAAQCDAVAAALERLLPQQPRSEIMRSSLAARGALLVAGDLGEATSFAECYAPEHLLVLTSDPRALLPGLRAAGTIFLGAPSSVAFGDYITGANHVPDRGAARPTRASTDLLRWSTYQDASPVGWRPRSGRGLAEAEGLPAHALAARLRAGDVSAETSAVSVAGSAAAAPAVGGGRGAGAARGVASAVGGGDVAYTPASRAAYRAIQPYDPGRLPCDVDLTDNTNLFAPSPSVRKMLSSLLAATVTRYPMVYASELKRALAELHGVDPANITTGCGSDDIIDSSLRAFCEPGSRVAYPDPTFGMVPVFGRMNALEPVAVPLGPEFELDAGELLALNAAAIYLCRPNNPTGTLFERAAVARVCREARGLVLLDEAYAAFAGEDMVQTSLESGRTLVLRTFSKAYGLAGLRLGYAIGPAELIAEVEKSRGPYKVNGVAEAAALAALAGDGDWVRQRIADVQANRERLAQALRARGARVWPSAANFVLLSVPGAATVWNLELRQRGVAVRPFAGLAAAGEGCA
jgi:histidinol-phosphate aminotransferase